MTPAPHTPKPLAPMPLKESLMLFLVPSVVFIALTYAVLPLLQNTFGLHPLLVWYLTGLMMFVPLFTLALLMAKRDGYAATPAILLERLRLQPPSAKDWLWILAGLVAVLVLTGAVFGLWHLASTLFGLRPMQMTPPFLHLEGAPKPPLWMLLVWFPFWFFNIMGEELLWRGYILPRQMAAHGNRAWLLNAALWTAFHACFGLDMIVLLLPLLFVLPWLAASRRNTWTGIALHGFLNGVPSLLIVLGVIH